MESTRRTSPGIFNEWLSTQIYSRSPQKKRVNPSREAEDGGRSQGPAEGEAPLEPQEFQLEGTSRVTARVAAHGH